MLAIIREELVSKDGGGEMIKLRQSTAKYLNWVDTATATAFEMGPWTSKGEIKEKIYSISEGKGTVDFIPLPQLFSFHSQSLEIGLHSVNTRIENSSVDFTSTAYECPCASNLTSPLRFPAQKWLLNCLSILH